MNCHRTSGVLAVWCPVDDLPDDVVDHLEGCDHCMAVFDLRFPPLPTARSAGEIRSIPRRRSGWGWWVAAAAAWLLSVPIMSAVGQPDPRVAAMVPPHCPLPDEPPPEECPSA